MSHTKCGTAVPASAPRDNRHTLAEIIELNTDLDVQDDVFAVVPD
jgi:hypothetical protein